MGQSSSHHGASFSAGPASGRLCEYAARVPLAGDFQRILDSLPPDWSQLQFDLRIDDEDRYIEAATILAQVNALGYGQHDWHWRILAAREFGHAAAAETVRGTLKVLDDLGIGGEIAVREIRSGRVEVTQMWGRPESVRQEFRRRRAQ
jgi:hypothetical protein